MDRTIGQHLDNLEARFRGMLTARKIMADSEWQTQTAARLAVALWWKREVWAYRAELAGLGPDPSQERDVCVDLLSEAELRVAATISSLWDMRKLERGGSPTETSLQHEAA